MWLKKDINSSYIRWLFWEHEARVLQLVTKDGTCVEFRSVSPEIWEASPLGENFNTFFLEHISGRYLRQATARKNVLLAQKHHREIKQSSGASVQRLESIEPNENTPHRHFTDRL